MSKYLYPLPRDKAVFDFIVAFKAAHDGNSPTLREICDGTDITTTSMASFYLRRLEKQGKIAVDTFRYHRIRVVGGRWTMGGAE